MARPPRGEFIGRAGLVERGQRQPVPGGHRHDGGQARAGPEEGGDSGRRRLVEGEDTAQQRSPREVDRQLVRDARELQVLARTLSGPKRDGFERQGASVRGWMGGLNTLGAGPYRLVGTTTLDEALKMAATAIRQTGKPVGLLVWRGRHAWVMSGFQATADPLLTTNFKVTAAIVLDPLYPHGSSVWGPSPKPREALTPKAGLLRRGW